MKFKTNAKCNGCVNAISGQLGRILSDQQWSIDLNTPDRILTVTASVDPEKVVEAVAAAGLKAELIS